MIIAKRRAREMALQMLYQQDLGGRPVEEVLAAFDPEAVTTAAAEEAAEEAEGEERAARRPAPRQEEKALVYARRLVEGTSDHREEIDELIRSQAENWRLERMPVIDRNILRLAIFEMLHVEEVPKIVILDEAIELAKRYGSRQSSRFVNGLLDGLLKRMAAPAESGG